MEDVIFTPSERETRRRFVSKSLLGIAGLSVGNSFVSGCSQTKNVQIQAIGRSISLEKEQRPLMKKDKSILSFVAEKNTQKAAYTSLKPLTETVKRDIGSRQVIIKPNAGVIGPQHHHEVADVNQLRGILDFLAPIYNRQIIIMEGTASQAVSMDYGFEEYGYRALEREYNVRLVDANTTPTTVKWILAGYHRPQPINLISAYLDPDVYLISACRMKTSGGVLVTLSIKNIAMGTPACHIELNRNGKPGDLNNLKVPRGLNEKANMHGGIGSKRGRELSYNIFSVASMGAYPDLAVLDGVVGADGNGPWSADALEHGVGIASNDCVAADRLASELMGVDYTYLPYIQWCAQAGIGRDNPEDVTYFGPDYKPYIKQYRLNSFDAQVEWIRELHENLS